MTDEAATKAYPTVPRAAVGAVVVRAGEVLLVRRRDPPNASEWAIPGGSVRLGETLQAAAEREVLEETGVRVRAGRPVFAFDAIELDVAGRVRYHYVIVDLLAEVLDGEPAGRDDALDARWFRLDALPLTGVNATTRELLARLFPRAAAASPGAG
jgi:ADP-ribose pyrophosphatase